MNASVAMHMRYGHAVTVVRRYSFVLPIAPLWYGNTLAPTMLHYEC